MTRGNPQKLIIDYVRDNGPCTVRDMAIGIAKSYKKDLTYKEITNHVKILKGHGQLIEAGEDRHTKIWGMPEALAGGI